MRPWSRRLGSVVRGGGRRGASAPVLKPSQPTIALATTFTIGATITITPGAGGGPVTSYTLYRDGVSAGTVVSGYTYVAADVGPSLTVKAIGPGGTSAASNALQTTTATVAALFDQHYSEPRNAGNTINAGKIQTQLDLSAGGHNLVSASAGVRPAQTANSLLGGALTGVYDGVDDYLSVASITRPKTYLLLYRMPTYASGQPILGYGAGAYPYLEKADVIGYPAIFATAAAKARADIDMLTRGYFFPLLATDDGSDPICTVYNSSLDGTVAATGTVHDVAARQASPGQFSVAALNGGTFPQSHDHAALGVASTVLTANQIATVIAYWRYTFYNQAQPLTQFAGTLTTQSDAQPGPYPTAHEGVSGNTIALCSTRMVGAWTGAGFTIGGAGDPGAGNRGSIETMCTTQAKANVVISLDIGTGDSTGTISPSAYQLLVQRMWAVANVGPGSIAKFILRTLSQVTAAPYNQAGEINTFNAALPGIVTTLQGLGIPAVLCDSGAVSVTLQSDGLHYTETDCQNVAPVIVTSIINSGAYGAGYYLCNVGDSRTVGGNQMTRATAQVRPYIAKGLAAAGG